MPSTLTSAPVTTRWVQPELLASGCTAVSLLQLLAAKQGLDLRRDLRLSGEGEESTCVLTSLAGRRIFVAVTPA